MTKPRPDDMVSYIPQAKNTLPRERIYFSIPVRISHIPLTLIHILCYRRFSYFCRFDTRFCSTPPSDYLQYSCKGTSYMLHKTHAHMLIAIHHRKNTIEPVCAPEIPAA